MTLFLSGPPPFGSGDRASPAQDFPLQGECWLRLSAGPTGGERHSLLVTIGGDADAAGVAMIRRRLLAIAGSRRHLTLDLCGVTRADGALVELLVDCAARAAAVDRDVRLGPVSAAAAGALLEGRAGHPHPPPTGAAWLR